MYLGYRCSLCLLFRDDSKYFADLICYLLGGSGIYKYTRKQAQPINSGSDSDASSPEEPYIDSGSSFRPTESENSSDESMGMFVL